MMDGWIPCSERPPKKSKNYLVAIRFESGYRTYAVFPYSPKYGCWGAFDWYTPQDVADRNISDIEITHWISITPPEE